MLPSLFVVCLLLTKQNFLWAAVLIHTVSQYCNFFSLVLLFLIFFQSDMLLEVLRLYFHTGHFLLLNFLPNFMVNKNPIRDDKKKSMCSFFKVFFIFRRVLLNLWQDLINKEEHGWMVFFPYLWPCKHYLVCTWAGSEISLAQCNLFWWQHCVPGDRLCAKKGRWAFYLSHTLYIPVWVDWAP